MKRVEYVNVYTPWGGSLRCRYRRSHRLLLPVRKVCLLSIEVPFSFSPNRLEELAYSLSVYEKGP